GRTGVSHVTDGLGQRGDEVELGVSAHGACARGWLTGPRCADLHGRSCGRASGLGPACCFRLLRSTRILPRSRSFPMSCEDICPLFRGPRCNVLPRGKGMLRGFTVLLVTAGMTRYALSRCSRTSV